MLATGSPFVSPAWRRSSLPWQASLITPRPFSRQTLLRSRAKARPRSARHVPGSQERSERGDRLRGGFAAADGASDVAVPLGGALGAGPVDAPARCAPRLAVGRPDSGCEVRAVAAAGELLGHPAPLEVLLGLARGVAEVPGEAADHGLAPFGLAAARPHARLLAFDEAHQDAGLAGRR